MEISSQRIETFDRIAESFSWALSHSRVSVESLGEFATLLYLIKHDQLRKVSNSDCKEGENLFVLQFSPSMIGDEMERWLRGELACIGLMRNTVDPEPEIESILQRYRSSMRLHQNQEDLIRTFDLIIQADLQDNEYLELLMYMEKVIPAHEGNKMDFPFFPRSLSKMIAAILHDKHKSIYDPFIGTASLLMDLPEGVNLFGSEINTELRSYTTLKLALRSSMDFCISYPVEPDEVTEIPGTCIISFPGTTRTPQPQNDRMSLDWPIKLFRENEKVTELVLVALEPFTYSDKYKELRKSLTDANLLDKIIHLPNGYFHGMAISASIIHLRKGRTEEDEIIIGNLAEDAEKVGRRNEISWWLFDQLINPVTATTDKDGRTVYFDNRGNEEYLYPEDIAKNDYLWSALLYDWDKHVSGTPRGAEEKPFKQIMKPFQALRAETTPDKVLYFNHVESVFDAPEEKEPREREIYRVVTEPVFVVGYSNKCPLYYLEASEDSPKYISRSEILYKCVDSTIYPLYLAHVYGDRPYERGIPDYVIDGEIFGANRNISLFLQGQIVGLPSKVAQEAKMEEAKSAYLTAQIEKTHMNEYVAAIKQQYIDEVRSRKHNMRPYLRKLKSNTELALELLENASSLEEMKPEMNKYLRALTESRKALSKIVDNLSNEDKFGEPQRINVYEWMIDYIKHYPIDNQFKLRLSFEDNIFHPANQEWEEGGFVEIAPSDLRRLCDCIIENACTHGFADKEGEHILEITCIFDEDLYEIRFTNNGTSLPEGMDVNAYGRRGETAGIHAGTGDGGYQVVSIATHYRGYVELNSTPQDEPNSKVTVSVFFPVAFDLDFDNSDEDDA